MDLEDLHGLHFAQALEPQQLERLQSVLALRVGNAFLEFDPDLSDCRESSPRWDIRKPILRRFRTGEDGRAAVVAG